MPSKILLRYTSRFINKPSLRDKLIIDSMETSIKDLHHPIKDILLKTQYLII